MQTTWEYSLETEVTRLLHCCRQLAVGFYKANNFHVLPLPTGQKNNSSEVYVPQLPYTQITRFWEKVKKIDIRYFPMKIEDRLLDETLSLLEKEKLQRPNFETTKSRWSQAQAEITKEIYRIMPEKKSFIGRIIVHPTSFGTSSSFGLVTKPDSNLIIYLREDQGIWTLTEAILSSLTRHDVYTKLDGLWQESELLVDWLITRTSLTETLRKYEPDSTFEPTSKKVRAKQYASLHKMSEDYYKKLGVPSSSESFSIKEGNPAVYGKKMVNLTTREQEIMLKLIRNANKVVTVDELGELIFSAEDDFSLYAISKVLQRLRDKLEDNGVSGSFIQTLRGKGYLLRDSITNN